MCIQNTLIHYVKNVFYLFVPHFCSAKRPHCCKRTVFHRQVDPNFQSAQCSKAAIIGKEIIPV